ncbi:hypothetical protein Hamer_G000383, partial [Homarus americanus]
MRAGLGVMMSVCIMQAARPYPIHLDVSVDALYCVLKGPDLSCNYTNGDQGDSYLQNPIVTNYTWLSENS